MAAFLKGLITGGLVIFFMWTLFWAGQLGRPHPNNKWIEEAIAYKEEIVRTLSSPGIVVVAGSGAMFGIDSHYLERIYGRTTVNLGVNAGISLPFILERAEKVIKPNTLVILPLEYPLYNREEAVSSSLVYWANSHPETFLLLPVQRAFKVFLHTSLTRILEGYRGLPKGFSVSGEYGVQHLDQHGDQTNTARSLREERHWNFLNSLPDETYGKAQREGRFDWTRLENFRDRLLERGACPVFIPPPLLFRESYTANFVEKHFYETLPEKVRDAGLYWRGGPFEAMRNANDFFDTNFHLVDEARQEYTRQVVKWLGDRPMAACREFYRSQTGR